MKKNLLCISLLTLLALIIVASAFAVQYSISGNSIYVNNKKVAELSVQPDGDWDFSCTEEDSCDEGNFESKDEAINWALECCSY